MSEYLNFSFDREILGPYPFSQIVSGVATLSIAWYLCANDGPLLTKARVIQGIGVLVLLPFGFKAAFLYFLLYCVCALYYTMPPAQTLDETCQDVYEPEDARIDIELPYVAIMHELPVQGWTIDIRYSLDKPHVSFPQYRFDFRKDLHEYLTTYDRSGTIFVEFSVNPANRTWDTDMFLYHANFNAYWDARLKVIHKGYQEIAVYEFALTQVWIRLPIESRLLANGKDEISGIPSQLRKGGAGGQAWRIEAPSLADFQKFIHESLAPDKTTEFPRWFSDVRSSRTSITCVDLAQPNIPIIVPILKSISFQSYLITQGVGPGSFYKANRNIPWSSLTHISLDSVLIFPDEYRAVLKASPELKTFVINRPGEGYGLLTMPRPMGLVKAAQLRTLHLIDCRVDVRNFLAGTVVDLQTVTELVVTSRDNNQSIQVEEMNIDWVGMHTLKLSSTFGVDFINGCRIRLSADNRLEVITV